MRKLNLKLNQKGFAHWIVPALVIVIIATIGTYVLTGSHAATLPPVQFSLSPSSIPAVSVGSTFTVSINVVPNGNSVQQAVATLFFPPNLLKCVATTPTTDFSINSSVNICGGGQVQIRANRNANYTQNGTLATFTLQALAPGAGTVNFQTLSGETAAYLPPNSPSSTGSTLLPSTVTNGNYTISPTSPTSLGEQLSIPPQRRPAQYVHLCVTGSTYYVTQGSPSCLPGGIFVQDYASTVPGTTYNVPCATVTSNSTSLVRLIYIANGATCPAGTSN